MKKSDQKLFGEYDDFSEGKKKEPAKEDSDLSLEEAKDLMGSVEAVSAGSVLEYDDEGEKALEEAEREKESDENESAAVMSVPPSAFVERIADELQEAIERVKKEEEKLRQELYEGETFDDGNLTFAEDIKAYDQAAYTRSNEDLTGYRYNLSSGYYSGTSAPREQETVYDEHGYPVVDDGLSGDLGADLDAASEGHGSPSPVHPATGGYGGGYGSTAGGRKAYGGYGGYGKYVDYDYGWGSSWYSGYNSVETAIAGVHDRVSTFVDDKTFGSLEIVSNLDKPETECLSIECSVRMLKIIKGQNIETKSSMKEDMFTVDDEAAYKRCMIIRVDSSLYEKLGISEAQQHYIVDGICQSLAVQSYPDPAIPLILQEAEELIIPCVIRELITEIARAKGIPIMLDKLPGWQKRITAFRSVMYIGQPKETDIPSAFLMYAVWEREDVELFEHVEAVKVIAAVEEILESPIEITSDTSLSAIIKNRREKVRKIVELVSNYILQSGAIGPICNNLVDMKETIGSKIKSYTNSDESGKNLDIATTLSVGELLDLCSETAEKAEAFYTEEEAEELKKKCLETADLIHNHNRTFRVSEKIGTAEIWTVKHHDHPTCPNKSLLPPEVVKRVEFSRKCDFNLERIPVEVAKRNSDIADVAYNTSITSASDMANEDHASYILQAVVKHPKTAYRRVVEMLQKFQSSKENQLADAEEALKALREYKPGEGSSSRSGNRATNHDFGHKAPLNTGTSRDFNIEDNTLMDRPCNIYDYTA